MNEVPKQIRILLKERLKYVQDKEIEIRLLVASLEGQLAEAKAELADNIETIEFLERFHAAESVLQ